MNPLSQVNQGSSVSYSSLQSRRIRPSNDFIEFKPQDVEQSIPQRFLQQVRRAPQQLAIKTRTQSLTYSQLHTANGRLAGVLLEMLGCETEPVALLLDREASFVLAMLGILSAKKIWVPLDTSFPSERLTYMLADANVRLIVTDTRNEALAHSLGQGNHQILNVDKLDSQVITEPLDIEISPDTLAAIVYTSGSTGQPKGVTQNHRNLLHTVMNFTNVYHVCADDRISSLSSPSGIGLAWFSLLSLLNGATYYPINVKDKSIGSIVDWIDEQAISILSAITPVYRLFTSELPMEKRFEYIRLVTVGGDRVYPNDLELYRQRYSDNCLFASGMGLTEVGRLTQHLMDSQSSTVDGYVPVGHPMDGMEVLLLDEDGHPVDAGQIGEVVVRSRYLSPGYWRRPKLNREVFLDDPNGGPERLYFTGDLGRCLPDGCLVHMGRKDSLVKIRGHRVALSEIEAALLELPAIKETIVLPYEELSVDRSLVAYVVPSPLLTPSITELREALRVKLPQHMIPSVFIFIEEFPLTPIGKVDRTALPSPPNARPGLETPLVLARTVLEQEVSNIWSELLSVDRIGVHDSFLELGGNSLLGIQMQNRMLSEFGVELKLGAFFEPETTIEWIANYILTSRD